MPGDLPNPYGGRGPEIMGVSWALMGMTTLLLVLRVVSRLARVNASGLQALLWAWSAWVLATLGVCFLSVAAHYGLGNHIEVVEAAGTITPAVKYQWIADAMISLAIGLGKFAVVSFYMEIQGPVYKWRQRGLMALVASNLANNVVLVFLIFFQCSPPASLWDKSIPGTCDLANVNLYYGIAGGAWNAATDVVLALYPIGIVYKLRMPLKLKFGLCILMGIGIFTAVCSIIKTYEFKDVEASTDPLYALSPLILWGVAEMWVILITASVPPLWPLVRCVVERAETFSSQHSFSSLLHISRRSRRADSESEMVDDDSGSEKYAASSKRSHEDEVPQIPKILVQKDITMTHEMGMGSSVTSTAEKV